MDPQKSCKLDHTSLSWLSPPLKSGNFYVSIKDEHTILLEFRSEKQDKIGGLKNSNPNKAHNILKLWTGNLSETDKEIDLFENIDESELIILKGDKIYDKSFK